MKKILWILCIAILNCLTMQAQRLTVYKISGTVEVVDPNGCHTLSAREVLTTKSVINIKYDSKVIVYDEVNRKQYTLKTPGRASVATLLADKRTTVIDLTERYLKYIKSQVFGKNTLVALSHNSDPATVTRDVDTQLLDSLQRYATLPMAKGGQSSPFEAQFNDFKQEARKHFDDFRRECADRYASFARLAWEEMGLEPPVPTPHTPSIEPITAPEQASQQGSTSVPVEKIFAQNALIHPFSKAHSSADMQPHPPVAVQEQKLNGINSLEFTLFETRFSLRYPAAAAKRLKLDECAENHVAEMMESLLCEDYDNLLHDCITIRDSRQLDDWAYYQLLKAVGHSLCPNSDDAAMVVTAFLFAQTGYKMRMVIIGDHLHLFAASEQKIYNRLTLTIDGTTYASLDPLDITDAAYVCNADFYDESRPMSLRLSRQPLLDFHSTPSRQIASSRYSEFSVETRVNQGMLDFYNTYPETYVEDNFMSRWGMYADVPATAELKQHLYPALQQLTTGMSKVEAAERILNWVQTGLDYKSDEEVWGHDRVFFVEESLYYPFCDCEDRAILFTRIVRDVLGLQCALVYYPNHLASAVHFGDATLQGDYIEHEGKHYIIADPAYIGARLGMTMESKKNDPTIVLILQ